MVVGGELMKISSALAYMVIDEVALGISSDSVESSGFWYDRIINV